ncbi:hypothetical protein SCA6_001092, partial [Theobroma cacao]
HPNSLLNSRTEEAGSLVRFIYNQSTASAVVNLRLAMRQYSGNIIRKMIFNRRYFGEGRKDGGPGYEEVEHVESLFTVLQHLYSFILSDYIPWLRSFDLEGNEKTVRKAMKTVNEYQDPLIDERVQEWREGKRTEPEDLLDCFILSKDSIGKPALSIEEIKAQCAELMLATEDNPSNAVDWAMAEMINQLETLLKSVEEIDTLV